MSAVTVAVVGTRVEADLMVGMLRNHGIRAQVSADDAGGVDLALQSQGVRVLVPADDAARARRLVDGGREQTARPNLVQRWLLRLLGGR